MYSTYLVYSYLKYTNIFELETGPQILGKMLFLQCDNKASGQSLAGYFLLGFSCILPKPSCNSD